MVLYHIKEGTLQQEFQNVFRGQNSSRRSMVKAVIHGHQDNTLYHWYGDRCIIGTEMNWVKIGFHLLG